MRLMITLIILFFALYVDLVSQSLPDTLYPSPQKQEQEIQWHHPYHQTLTMKLFLSYAPYKGDSRRKDKGGTEVYLTFRDALEVIKKIDRLTMGMPKIIYLTGWQYNGHDSKYPAFFKANPALKRPQDEDALESLRWLMRKAYKYHTTVSLHINMMDAYEDSPLWDAYLKYDIIARWKNGDIRKAPGWGYPISYTQEWKTGFARKRIDSLCQILPIEKAGTIHIDAFHTWVPRDPKGPISPYLGYSVKQEEETQRKIFKYWASKGIDVTSEFVGDYRSSVFEGYQPMAWHFRITAQQYLDWPASFYTGGVDGSKLGKVFGTSMYGEGLVKKYPDKLTGLKKQFCTSTLIWQYLNAHERKFLVTKDSAIEVHFSDNIVSSLTNDGSYTLRQDDRSLVEEENVFIQAGWMEDKSIVVYSADGYQEKTWKLPENWSGVKRIAAYNVSLAGREKVGEQTVQNNSITLSMDGNQQLLLKAL